MAELDECLIGVLHSTFRSGVTLHESFSNDLSVYSTEALRSEIAIPRDYQIYIPDSPLAGRFTTSEVTHLRGHVSRTRLEKTAFYNELFRPLALVDQATILIPWNGGVTCYTLNAGHLFTADEIRTLSFLRQHVQAALHRVSADARQLLHPGSGNPWIELTPAGRPAGVAPEQAALLRAYFPSRAPASSISMLPPPVENWLTGCARKLADRNWSTPLPALFADAPRGRLRLRFYPARRAGGGAAIRLQESPAAVDLMRLGRRAGLSAREAEILHWLGLGKRNAEIGTILGVAPKTVGKHVEHILRKLGATNRISAVRQLVSSCGGRHG
ncbi:LuxR family transcriptional regulator [Opitutaceae bacterium TAV5]|nr:LuxR family transcriptional regulator [Opitutaceae bacterium TAV5]